MKKNKSCNFPGWEALDKKAMQKNKTTKDFNKWFDEWFDRKDRKWVKVPVIFIKGYISQERKQWEKELREEVKKLQILDQVYQTIKKTDILSLLESKEEEGICDCDCHPDDTPCGNCINKHL